MSGKCKKNQKEKVLGLREPSLDWKSAQEAYFGGLNNNFFSDKTPMFFTFSALKDLIYT